MSFLRLPSFTTIESKGFLKTFLPYILALVFWKVVQNGVAVVATQILPLGKHFTAWSAGYAYDLPYLVWIWGNFDGVHYVTIAKKGYELLMQPFFPLYPLTINLIHQLTQLHFIISGLVVSHVTFILALFVLYLTLKIDGYQKLFPVVLGMVLIFPTSFAYGSVYNDSLFFLFANLSIYFGRKQSWALASVWGAIASLARLNGLAIAAFLFFEWIATKKTVSLKNISVDDLVSVSWIFLIPLAFLSYLLYIEVFWQDWRLLFSTMDIWGQSQVTLPPVVIYRYLKILLTVSPSLLLFWVAAVEFLAFCWYGIIILYSFFKLRFSYTVFLLISILIPLLTGTLAGMPRYGLHLYPLFLSSALLFLHLSKPSKVVFIICHLTLAVFIITLFTRGYFVT